MRLALRRGLETIAVTDHDTTRGIAPALDAAKGTSLLVIPGIEISTDIPRSEIHILGYFIDYDDSQLQQILDRLRLSRFDRGRRIVAKLDELGMHIEWDRVQEIAGDAVIGRPHVAQALIEKGYVATSAEAFAKYIGRNGPAYVERYKLTPVEAVQLIIAAKGIAVIAHPIIASLPKMGAEEQKSLETLLPELVQAGLVGIESYYAGYTPEIERYLLGLAQSYDLVPTGGSDYHGLGILPGDLGMVEVPRTSVDGLRVALARRTKHGA